MPADTTRGPRVGVGRDTRVEHALHPPRFQAPTTPCRMAYLTPVLVDGDAALAGIPRRGTHGACPPLPPMDDATLSDTSCPALAHDAEAGRVARRAVPRGEAHRSHLDVRALGPRAGRARPVAAAAGVRTVADAASSGYSSGPAVSVSPIGGGEHVAQCQCQGPRSRRPALSQRARPPQYWQAGTSRRSSMGIEEDGDIGALLQLVCDVWMRWPLSLRAPVGKVQRAAVCVGCARERAAGS